MDTVVGGDYTPHPLDIVNRREHPLDAVSIDLMDAHLRRLFRQAPQLTGYLLGGDKTRFDGVNHDSAT